MGMLKNWNETITNNFYFIIPRVNHPSRYVCNKKKVLHQSQLRRVVKINGKRITNIIKNTWWYKDLNF